MKSVESELRRKQRNILPSDTLPNAASVDGYIIRGDKPFTKVQRVGAVILGVLYCSPGIAGIIATFALASGTKASKDRPILLVLPLLLLVSAGCCTSG